LQADAPKKLRKTPAALAVGVRRCLRADAPQKTRARLGDREWNDGVSAVLCESAKGKV
jgi:hypothetical protein